MNRKNGMLKLFSVAMCIMLVLCAFAVTACAASTINLVEISNLNVPEEGETPDYEAAVGLSDYEITSIVWFDNETGMDITETDKFIAGHSYRVRIYLSPLGGYEFKTNSTPGNPVVAALLNGSEEGVGVYGSATSLLVQYDYPACKQTKISSVSVSDLDIPVFGKTPDFTATTDGTGYVINTNAVEVIGWYEISNGIEIPLAANETFKKGCTYRVYVALKTEGDYRFAVDDPSDPMMELTITAKISGRDAYVVPTLGYDNVATIYCDFDICVPTLIESVAPGCEAAGKEAYYRCEDCGKCFEDADATVEIADIDTWGVIAATGHDYKAVTTKATLSANGKIENICNTCGGTELVKTIYKPSKFTLAATSYTYNGKVKTPALTVKDSKGNTLVKNKDYTVKYASGRKAIGKYAVTITFKGNYTGTKTVYFNIVPKGTTLSKLTAKSVGFTAEWKKQTSNTTGYQIQYSTNKNFTSAKLSTITKNTTLTKTFTGLKESTKYFVRVRTYKTVNGTKFYSDWSAYKYITTKPAIKVTLNTSTTTLYKGATKTVKATTYPTNVTVTWKTSDKAVATVDSTGKIKAVGKGTATITASFKYNGKTYKDTVTVKVKNATISLSKTSASIKVGGSVTLKATVNPTGGTVKWTTSNSKIATVSAKGKVTGKAKGSATITATYTYKGYTYKKTCKVTVTAGSSVATNINKLKNYINNYGFTNKNGHKGIKSTYTMNTDSNVYTLTFAIINNTSTGKLDFISVSEGKYYPSFDQSISFSINASSTTSTVESIILYYDDYGYDEGVMGAGTAYATLNLKNFTRNTDLDFRWDYDASTSNIANSDGEDLMNSYLQVSFAYWDKLLYEECGLRMKNIGFTNYTA